MHLATTHAVGSTCVPTATAAIIVLPMLLVIQVLLVLQVLLQLYALRPSFFSCSSCPSTIVSIRVYTCTICFLCVPFTFLSDSHVFGLYMLCTVDVNRSIQPTFMEHEYAGL